MIAKILEIDVLDLPADALIYSTNVLLNCSGGVGACPVERYGRKVQEDLHGLLRARGTRFAQQGSVFQHVSLGMLYRRVFHTVPSDAFYDTTPEIIAEILSACLLECVDSGAVHTIALTALATGYGHLAFEDFFLIASSVLSDIRFADLSSATICIPDAYSFGLAADLIRKESLPLTVG